MSASISALRVRAGGPIVPAARSRDGAERHEPSRPTPRLDAELSVEFVTQAERLAELVSQWSAHSRLGFDTEFVRERTYYAQPGLIQVATADSVSLIDTVAIPDLRPFGALLENPSLTKVFHAAGEDLQLLNHETGASVRGVFDCQVAAAFCGRGNSLGYLKLVKAIFDVELAKGETRSNWLARPLSDAQTHYAALDTAYLLALHDVLTSELASTGHAQNCTLENERLAAAERIQVEPDAAYARVRGHERLSASQQLRLQTLAAWRERVARERDVPRTHVIRDAGLLCVAREETLSLRRLKADDIMHPRSVRRFGEALLEAHQSAAEMTSQRGLKPLSRRLAKDLATTLLPRLREAAEHAAVRAGLPLDLLAPRRELEALLVAYDAAGRQADETALPESLDGWRRELIGTPLLNELRAAPS